MSKHTIKGYIVYETWTDETTGKYKFQSYKPITCDNYTQVPVCEHELTFDMPEGFDPRPGQIERLQELKQKVRAEFSARITEIEQQISKLQAIDYTEPA